MTEQEKDRRQTQIRGSEWIYVGTLVAVVAAFVVIAIVRFYPVICYFKKGCEL